MKVTYVIDSLTPAGTESSTVLLAEELCARGHQCLIAILRQTAPSLESRARSAGIEVVQVRGRRPAAKVSHLRSLLRGTAPDLVHTALFNADQIGRVAAWRLGIPVVSSLVGTPWANERLSDPNVRRFGLQLARTVDTITSHLFVDRFFAVSEGVKGENAIALRFPPDRIDVVERGRIASQFSPATVAERNRARRALGVQPGDPLVLSVGRLDHHKSQVDLLAAVSKLLDERPRVTLAIAGKPGSASERIQHLLSHDEKLQRHTLLLGHRTDVADLLGAADVLAISSRVEGTAGVALEALGVGTPVVSTDLRGLAGVLQHDRNALFVPIGDSAAMAASIDRLLGEPVLRERLVKQGRADFLARFTLEKAADRLVEAYNRLLREYRQVSDYSGTKETPDT